MLGMEAGRLVKQRSTYNTYVAQQAVEAVRSSIPPWLKDRVDQFHAKQNSSN